ILEPAQPIASDEHVGSEKPIRFVLDLESFQGVFQHVVQPPGIFKVLGEFGSVVAGLEGIEQHKVDVKVALVMLPRKNIPSCPTFAGLKPSGENVVMALPVLSTFRSWSGEMKPRRSSFTSFCP